MLEVAALLGLRWQHCWGGGVIGVKVVASLWLMMVAAVAVTRGQEW